MPPKKGSFKHTAEARKKIGEANRRLRRADPQLHSDEAREKIRQANIGKYTSPETKAKISASMQGIRRWPDEIERMRQSANQVVTSKEIREERRMKVAELHVRGLSMRQIAAELGWSPPTIMHDIRHNNGEE